MSDSPEAAVYEASSAAEELADAGLLTERQAAAYALCDVYGIERERAAGVIGITVSTLDKHLQAGREKVTAARDTRDVLDSLDRTRADETPDEADD